jgi:hypothetical protein
LRHLFRAARPHPFENEPKILLELTFRVESIASVVTQYDERPTKMLPGVEHLFARVVAKQEVPCSVS